MSYRLHVVNAFTGKLIDGCVADSAEDLSRLMPISINGTDRATIHAEIHNPDDWTVVIKGLNCLTGKWEEIEDPRIFFEDIEDI
ncbi:hypothetical protein KI440_01765 [Candidatus Saccharibacteria bacterium TM7i]|nr:hypothetical protein KI440_01765 [Candidatus Saccharibacteria bacterium TM7i]